MAKKLAKAQMGKIVKSTLKNATNFANKNKDMKTLLKANVALGTGAAGWMAIDQNAKKKKLGVHAPSLDSLTKKQTGGKTSVSNSKEAFFNNLKKGEPSKNVYTPAQMDSVNFARKIKNSPITKAKENITKTLKTGGAVKAKKK